MSKWCLTVVVGALLALPSFAKHKNSGVEDGIPTATDAAAKSADASDAVNVAPAPDFFAMPAMPRATPFPGPTPTPDEPPGRPLNQGWKWSRSCGRFAWSPQGSQDAHGRAGYVV